MLAFPPAPKLQSNQRSFVLIVTIQLMHPCADTFPHFRDYFFFSVSLSLSLTRNGRKFRPGTAIFSIVLLLFWQKNFSKPDVITLLTFTEWKHFTGWTFFGDHTLSSAQTTRSNRPPHSIKEQTGQLTVTQNTGSVWTLIFTTPSNIRIPLDPNQ